jgi:glycine/D-amino acid oxidase-like deaminating enzyme
MDLHSGVPYFWIRNGLPFLYPTLDAPLRCQVLVVGAGITGALCAHACAEAGLDVVVIEAASVGTSSTSASTALLQYEIDTPMHELVGHVGLDAAVRSYRTCAEAVVEIAALGESLGVASRRRKSVQFASRRGHVKALRAEYELRREHGFDVELLTAADFERLLGFRRPAAMLSALGAEIDPYAFTLALFQQVLARGGRIYDRTAMRRHTRQGDGLFQVETQRGHTIVADHLVVATGYESARYLPNRLLDLQSTYAVASERLELAELWHEDCLIWETAHPYLYLRTTPDRRVIVGGVDEPYRNPARRDALLDRKSRQLAKAFRKLFPHLPFEAEYCWCGTFGVTKDGLPFIDRDRDGVWFVLGMGGNGITFSQVGAKIVRDAILGRANADAELFRFDR